MVLYGVTILFSPSLCTKFASCTQRVERDTTVHRLLARLQTDLKLQKDAEDLEVYRIPTTHLWLGSAGIAACCDPSRRLSSSDRVSVHAQTSSSTLGYVLYLTERSERGENGRESVECALEDRETGIEREELQRAAWVSDSDSGSAGSCTHRQKYLPGLQRSSLKLPRRHEPREALLERDKTQVDLDRERDNAQLDLHRKKDSKQVDLDRDRKVDLTGERGGECDSAFNSTMDSTSNFVHQESPLPDSSSSTPSLVPPSVEECDDESRGVTIPPSLKDRVLPDKKTVEIVTISSGGGEELGEALHKRDSQVDIDRERGRTQIDIDRERDNTQVNLDRERDNTQVNLDRERDNTQVNLDRERDNTQVDLDRERDAHVHLDKYRDNTQVDLDSGRGEVNEEHYDSAFNSTMDSTSHFTLSPPLQHTIALFPAASQLPLSLVKSLEISATVTNEEECPRMGERWVCKQEEGEQEEGKKEEGDEVLCKQEEEEEEEGKQEEGEEVGSDEGIGMEVVGESGDSGEGGSVIVIDSDTTEAGSLLRGSGMEQSRVVHCCGMELSHNDLCTLSPNQCLNDQVINCYMKLLMTECPCKKNRIFIASTFFYTKLCRSGLKGVTRWMKNVDFTKLRLFLVPVHLPGCHHWCLAAVHIGRRIIEYYDSLNMRNSLCMKKLLQFVCYRTQKHIKPPSKRRPWQTHFKTRHWRKCYPKGLPKQVGGFDCGVFVCQFARWLCCSDGRPHSSIHFSQSHMYRIRQIMRQELEFERLVQLDL